MSTRLSKIRRIVSLRERALQQEVSSLGIARMSESAAVEEEASCGQELRRAEGERRNLSAEAGSVLRFLELEDWLETLGIKHTRALQGLKLARLETERARNRVRQARVSLKQVEMLKERIATREQEAEKRRERRLEDEVSTQLLSFGKGR